MTTYTWGGVSRADAAAYHTVLTAASWLCGDPNASLTICTKDQGTTMASILFQGGDLTVTVQD